MVSNIRNWRVFNNYTGGLFGKKKPGNLYNTFGSPPANRIGWEEGDRPRNGIWSYARFLEE